MKQMTKKLEQDLRWCVENESGYNADPLDVQRIVSAIDEARATIQKMQRDHEAMELLRNAKPDIYVEVIRNPKGNEPFECLGAYGDDPVDVIEFILRNEGDS